MLEFNKPINDKDPFKERVGKLVSHFSEIVALLQQDLNNETDNLNQKIMSLSCGSNQLVTSLSNNIYAKNIHTQKLNRGTQAEIKNL